MKKRNVCICISVFMFMIFTYPNHLLAVEEEIKVNEVGSELEEDHVFTTMNKEGDIVEVDIHALEEETKQEMEKFKKGVIAPLADVNVGVVNFNVKDSAKYNTNYIEEGTGYSGYLNGYYAADGAFLGYNSDRSKVKFMIAGVVGWVNASEVVVLDYNSTQVKSVNFYRSEKGILYHYGTSNVFEDKYELVTQVGKRQSYMQDDVVYYSYDGHYFYKTYAQMISDYKANIRSNAINPNTPYYNYYQYLSHRTKSEFNANEFNSYVLNVTKNDTSSKMNQMGQFFIDNQNKYGANASLVYGVAANESGWGRSNIAKTKNNLFGHAAYDSDPSGSANGYSSPAYSIYYHAKVFVSEGYLDPLDFRYFGSHLGDKASGMNVKYASDPYWGEKAASVSWRLHNTYNKDVGKYTIAIKDKNINLNVRNEPNTSSPVLYQTRLCNDYPFLILGSVVGESVNGSTKWYKIQSDSTLNESRNAITQNNGEYDYPNYYGYVHSSYVNEVRTSINKPITISDDPKLNDEIVVIYRSGNTNESIFTSEYSTSECEINMIIKGKELTDTELKNIKWEVESVHGFSNKLAYVNAVKEINKITAKKSGIIKLTLTYNGTAYNTHIVIPGDVTRDGILNTADAIRIQKYASSKTPNINDLGIVDAYTLLLADMNGDRMVNTLDRSIIQKMVAKTIKPSN